MKTPERWRALPRRILILGSKQWRSHADRSCANVTSRRHVTSRHDVTWRPDVTPWCYVAHLWYYVISECMYQPRLADLKFQKSHFLTWWPWPLTYDLDHRTHVRYRQGQSLHQILGPYIKRFRRERAEWQTHTQTDGQTGPILYPRPLTREGKMFELFEMWYKNFKEIMIQSHKNISSD